MTDTTVEPPPLVGFEPVRFLGGGGFADVFLYQQRRPNRPVAIKVLKVSALGPNALADFDAEADLMASVSAHPFIVTIFDTGISEAGRPYLVMEYYRNKHLGLRAQQGMSVAEVLRTGVQVGSAVETLHQAGIIHRDIKPANILMSEFTKPGLTDFGIAGVQTNDPDEESRGASIPYAPPEVVSARSAGDQRADVYSLGATLYALLARRTPFERGTPERGELIQRILTAPPPPLERPDVPRALELLLLQALAKDPTHRPQSPAQFAASLQAIERELGYDPTPLEVRDLSDLEKPATDESGDDHTRARGSIGAAVVSSRPVITPRRSVAAPSQVELPPFAAPPLRQPDPAASPDLTIARPPSVAIQRAGSAPANPDSTVARPRTTHPAAGPSTTATVAKASRRTLPRVVIASVIVLGVAVAGLVVLHKSSAKRTPGAETTQPPDLSQFATPETPTHIAVRRSGTTWIVTWQTTGTRPGDTFQVQRKDVAGEAAHPTARSPYVLPGVRPGQRPCVVLVTVSKEGQPSELSPDVCAP